MFIDFIFLIKCVEDKMLIRSFISLAKEYKNIVPLRHYLLRFCDIILVFYNATTYTRIGNAFEFIQKPQSFKSYSKSAFFHQGTQKVPVFFPWLKLYYVFFSNKMTIITT